MHDTEQKQTGTPRSLLFCPGSDSTRMRKALASPADAVILDLEDSVAPAAKAGARASVAAILTSDRPKAVIVRVNAADSGDHLADLVATVANRPEAIMLPKCTGPADLLCLSQRLDALEAAFGQPAGAVRILPLVTETAASLARLDYAGVTPRLMGLAMAGEDLASDLGIPARTDGVMNPLLQRAREQVAVAAAAAGVPAFDTPFPDPRDAAGLKAETEAAVALGLAGKLCIHPAQLAAVNTAFQPSEAQVTWGRAVIAALDGAGKGVATVEGRMVDIAHLRLARRYVAGARR